MGSAGSGVGGGGLMSRGGSRANSRGGPGELSRASTPSNLLVSSSLNALPIGQFSSRPGSSVASLSRPDTGVGVRFQGGSLIDDANDDDNDIDDQNDDVNDVASRLSLGNASTSSVPLLSLSVPLSVPLSVSPIRHKAAYRNVNVVEGEGEGEGEGDNPFNDKYTFGSSEEGDGGGVGGGDGVGRVASLGSSSSQSTLGISHSSLAFFDTNETWSEH